MNANKCPNYECTLGRVPDRSSPNGLTRCPVCAGKGFLMMTLPIPIQPKVFASDLGFTKGSTHWREMSAMGSLRGLPITGKAIATDGVLVIIEQPDGRQFTGHLENFIRVKQPSKKTARQPKEDVNAELFD